MRPQHISYEQLQRPLPGSRSSSQWCIQTSTNRTHWDFCLYARLTVGGWNVTRSPLSPCSAALFCLIYKVFVYSALCCEHCTSFTFDVWIVILESSRGFPTCQHGCRENSPAERLARSSFRRRRFRPKMGCDGQRCHLGPQVCTIYDFKLLSAAESRGSEIRNC